MEICERAKDCMVLEEWDKEESGNGGHDSRAHLMGLHGAAFSPCSIWYLSAFTQRAGQVTGGVFIMLGGSKHLNSPCPGPTVSDIGKVPLQRALQVTVSDFPDRSDAVLQPIR